MLQSEGQNQKRPTSGPNGYVTPTVSGLPQHFRAGWCTLLADFWAKRRQGLGVNSNYVPTLGTLKMVGVV